MQSKHNKNLVPFAKDLRKNMTKEERHLWYDFLRDHPIRFSRQKVLGKYIVDFYSAQAKVVVELDGSQHYTSAGEMRDFHRSEFLFGYGLRVLHFSNKEVNENFAGVCHRIDYVVKQSLSQALPDSSLCTREPLRAHHSFIFEHCEPEEELIME